MAEIELEHLTKTFSGGVTAVADVNLRIEDGEFMVLVGPSGCGKSTLLRMIAGLEEVTAGRISIEGRDVTDLAPRQRDVAMVFQNYALYPHMNVRQNIGYGLKVRRTAKDEIRTRVEEVAELLGLGDLLDRRRPPRSAEGHVVLGIRPEAFEDAAFAPADSPAIDAVAEVIEELGSDAHVFFHVDAPRLGAEGIAAGGEDDEATLLAETKALFNARVD